ncbi:hypothetical protein B0A50_07180 [Salinomyces thailandicus]|uniref:Diaminopimelate epimerase-like protein n=1 Tax=Salinomyces thailandicus TaxID=706561 RepID=A0A4U0TMG7_9PEZI|nr:hypothetical protein B0A50_07180 [Salinomyces thailandica]
MPSLPFVTLDVFTSTRFRGNPLGLVKIPASQQDLPTPTLQNIANEFNLSETVFLYEGKTESDGVTEWRYRIFMTDQELPFAGHPTIGTACYALQTLAAGASKGGRLICAAGPVDVEYDGSRAKCAIPHNVHVHASTAFSEKDLLELQPSLRSERAIKAVEVVSPVKGMNFICVELQTLEDLALVELGRKPVARLDEDWNRGFTGGYYYVTLEEDEGRVLLRSRMIEGSLEDPATGSAACALSSLLALKRRRRSTAFNITQGVEMGRRSDIGVNVTLKPGLDTVEKVELSGSAVKVTEGSIEYD